MFGVQRKEKNKTNNLYDVSKGKQRVEGAEEWGGKGVGVGIQMKNQQKKIFNTNRIQRI